MVMKTKKDLTDTLLLRTADKEDGAAIWELIKSTGNLDLNSSYSYLMLCEFFPDTCIVAEANGKIVGFVSAFRPPNKPDTIFVWQVAVAKSQQGKGLGSKLLRTLLKQESCSDVHYLEATISPSNLASQSLFKKLAHKRKTNCEISECFSEDHFPEGGHEAEMTFRIGPL